MNKEDAIQAIEYGADAIWISNGGGTVLDTMPSTISVLKAIATTIKKAYPKIEIYIDGGIRRGTDVMKCLAYGANCVFLGTPIYWALHANGKQGVFDMLDMLKEEMKLAMVLTNCMDIKEITE
jgi:(S)-2-hydroxy-acid oxidase